MSKTKKILVSIIVLIVATLGIITVSNAAHISEYINYDDLKLNSQVTINLNDIGHGSSINSSNSNVFCIQHGQYASARYSVSYTVRNIITITGLKSTDKRYGVTFNSKNNAKLLEILNNNEDKYNVQNALWNFIDTWVNNVGTKHGISKTFVGNHDGASVNLDKVSDSKANEYIETEKASIKDNTIDKNITGRTVGSNFIVGPFNWTFSGKLTNISVYNENNKKLSDIKFTTINGAQTTITSGKNFYVSIPIILNTEENTEYYNIKKIEGTVTETKEVKSVKLWFLEASDYTWQNVLLRKVGTETERISNTFEQEYNTNYEGSLKIVKVDKNNKKLKLQNVGFKIGCVVSENECKYVSRSANGKITYVPDQTRATEFITNKNGEINITGLRPGTYVIIETKNPNYGYKVSEKTEMVEVKSGSSGITIQNEKVYIKLSGYVWVDKLNDKTGDGTRRDNLYNEKDDTKLSGITVNLRDTETGKIIKTTETSNDGSYIFKDVLIENLEYYNIEFEYNGLNYTNVAKNLTLANGSKAVETERTEFNKKYNSIEAPTKNELDLLFSGCEFNFVNGETNLILGDVNLNGSLDDEDIKLVESYVVKYENPSTIIQKELADVNRDGKITAEDVLEMLKIQLGTSSEVKGNLVGVTRDSNNNVTNYILYYRENYKTELIKILNNTNNITDYIKLPVYRGDVNFDGKVDKEDATMILEYVVKKIEFTEIQEKIADVDKNGTINAVDALEILKNLGKQIKIKGDVNGDNQIDQDDSNMILEHVVKSRVLTGEQFEIADVNNSGGVDAEDSLAVLFMINNGDTNGDRIVDEEEAKVAGFIIEEDGNVQEKQKETVDLSKYDADKNNQLDVLDVKKLTGKTRTELINTLSTFSESTCPNGYITADTNGAGYSIKDQYNKLIKTNPALEEITNINLGIYEREQPNISLVKDIQDVKVTANGYDATYKYANRFTHQDEIEKDMGVKFGDKYAGGYTAPVYEADYKNATTTDEFNVAITYKIVVKNTSSNLNVKVNDIVDYFDSKYETASIVVGSSYNEETGSIGNTIATNVTDSGVAGYKKMTISTNLTVGAGKTSEIYVQFTLGPEAVKVALNNDEKVSLYDNVAEISSYTVLKGKSVYAGIDTNSAPGDTIPGNKSTYEDDTDCAPDLKLQVAEQRTMTGTVFVDSTSNGLQPGKVRQGSGIYENGETTISGVNVTLREINGLQPDMTTITGDKGEFIFSGYTAGTYQVIYTWGDKTYTVQDYKGTIFDDDVHNGGEWYKTSEPRYSDAKDNWDTRKLIDKQTVEKVEDGEKRVTTMNSTTSTMNIGVVWNLDENGNIDANAIDMNTFRYDVTNIDFGIVERARQQMNISKDVSSVKITLANGQVLVDAKIEDGKLVGNAVKGVTYMPPFDGTNGMIKAEIDNELIQGATVQIGYTINVANNSELDYDSQAYYYYGTKIAEKDRGNKITMELNGVYDYLDSEMALDSSVEEQKEWTVISRSEYEKTYENRETLIEKFFKDGKTIKTSEDGTQVETYEWETALTEYQTIFTEWAYQTETTSIRNIKLDNKTILKYNLEDEVEPGFTKSMTLYASKLLSNSDEIDLNNDVELTEVNRKQEIGRIPDIRTSTIYDRGESVTVTPPTGENQNYIIPIIVGTIALIILGAGIVLIKKKVVNK